MADYAKILSDAINIDKISDALLGGALETHDIALVKKTCETFTRLLLSLTPYKAKEFVEKNCSKVSDKIISSVMLTTLAEITGDKDE